MATLQPENTATDQRPLLGRQRVLEFIARYGIFLVLLALVVAMAIATPLIRDGRQLFLDVDNFLQVAQQASINAIIAIGMTFIITSGGIDLSVGSLVGLTGVVTALVLRDVNFMFFDVNFGIPIGILTAMIVGTLGGLFNGFLITILRLSPFIATLGTLGIFRGLALVIADGRAIYPRTTDTGFAGFRAFLDATSARVGGEVSIAIIVAGVVTVIALLLLTQTKFGKYTIAIGGNEETTRLAGIPVRRYKMGIYALGGLLTGIAGALLMSRLNSGDPTFGRLFELDAIAAAVMGGTSLAGGEGSILGTLVGALIISLVQNAMNLWNIPSFWQQFIIGLVIVLAVMLDQWRKSQTQQV
jgi:ribose/xylose/arabinose/galactoside ABC-type transport system permease subunit